MLWPNEKKLSHISKDYVNGSFKRDKIMITSCAIIRVGIIQLLYPPTKIENLRTVVYLVVL